jgi:hypothetical protein
MTQAQTSPPWYEKKALVIALVIGFWPIGIYGLWKSSQFGRPWKLGVPAFILLATLLVITQPPEKGPVLDSGNSMPAGANSATPTAGLPTTEPSLENLRRLDRSSPDWLPMKFELLEMARAPHARGVPYDVDSGDGWKWKYDLMIPFKMWLATQPEATIVTSVILEEDAVCGDQQAVIVCKQVPELDPFRKTGFLQRIVANTDFFVGDVPIAIAVDGNIVWRWYKGDVIDFLNSEVGARPEPGDLFKDSANPNLTLAERKQKQDAFLEDLAAWKGRFAAFWQRVGQEAGLPHEDK